MNIAFRWILALACFGVGAPAQAQLPITVEDLFAKQDSFALGLTLSYYNLGPQVELDFVEGEHPLYIHRVTDNVDQLTWGVNGRYGASKNTEVSVDLTMGYKSTRRLLVDSNSSSERTGERLSFSVSHRLSEDAETPALLLSGQVEALHRSRRFGSGTVYGKEFGVSLVTYRTLDPILLSARATVSYHRERKVNIPSQENERSLGNGYSVQLEPRLSFFVNSTITLAAGISWSWSDKLREDGRRYGINRTATSTLLGLDYKVNKKMALHFESSLASSSGEGIGLTLQLVYRK